MDSTEADHSPRKLLQELISLLAPFSARCVLIGGGAYNNYREPRYTADLDFVIMPSAIGPVMQVLAEYGYVITREQGMDSPSGPDFVRMQVPNTSRKVEFQTAFTEYQELLIDRAVPISGAESIRAATPEDLVILKLIANRPKDQRDLLELGQMPDIDWAYVEEWAPIWGIVERLASYRAWLERGGKTFD